MPQQKIPLFSGLVKACQDGVGTPAINSLFSPPDVALGAGTQSYYAVHLWLKPTAAYTAPPGGAPANFVVTASRGSDPSDKRPVWSSNSWVLNQAASPSVAELTDGAKSDYGIPVKILDGYLVRGDVALELVIAGATVNAYASADPAVRAAGTFVWGYYQRVGTDDAWRFIGEPPAGPKFDTGLPIRLLKDERKIIHTFEYNRFDELFIQMVTANLDPATGPFVLSLADANEVDLPHSTLLFQNSEGVLGAPNGLRDPVTGYNFHGVFGGNAKLKYLMAMSAQAGAAHVHGRFNRH